MRFRNLLLTTVLSFAIAGCDTISVFDGSMPVKSRFDAMSSQFNVSMVASLDELEAALKPNFKLTADQAVAQVLPTTAISVQRRSTSAGASLTLALPTSVAVNERINTSTDGVDSTTETERRTNTSGEPSAVGDSSPGSPSLRDAVGLAASNGSVGVDPVLKYHNALSLYHQVQLLNHTISNAALRHGMRPYVVSLDINITPFRRDVSADFYAQVMAVTEANLRANHNAANKLRKNTASEQQSQSSSNSESASQFRCSERAFATAKGERLPVVVPLFASDNLELAETSRLIEALRRFSTALGGTIGTVGASAGLSLSDEQLDAILANDINSLQTMGQTNENSVQVRLGAQRQATSKHALVPRTHRITMVVLVPTEYLKHATESGTGRACMEFAIGTYLRHSESGKFVDDGMQEAIPGELKRISEQGAALPKWLVDGGTGLQDVVDQIQKGTSYTEYLESLERVRAQVCATENPDSTKGSKTLGCDSSDYLDFAQFLYNELAAFAARSAYRSVPFEVGVPRKFTLSVHPSDKTTTSSVQTASEVTEISTVTTSVLIMDGPKNPTLTALIPVSGRVDTGHLSVRASLDGQNWTAMGSKKYDKNTRSLVLSFTKLNFKSMRPRLTKDDGETVLGPIEPKKVEDSLKIKITQHLPPYLSGPNDLEEIDIETFSVKTIETLKQTEKPKGVKVADGGISKIVTNADGIGTLQLVISEIPNGPAKVTIANAQTVAVSGLHAKTENGIIIVEKPTTVIVTLSQLVPGNIVAVETRDKSGGPPHKMSLSVTQLNQKN